MKTADSIREQIRRMKNARIEPSSVTVCNEVYSEIGKPRKMIGVPVDCDSTMDSGWMVW